MHTIQHELDRMIDAGLPGAFVYVEDANGASRFFTAGFADLLRRQRIAPVVTITLAVTQRPLPLWSIFGKQQFRMGNI